LKRIATVPGTNTTTVRQTLTGSYPTPVSCMHSHLVYLHLHPVQIPGYDSQPFVHQDEMPASHCKISAKFSFSLLCPFRDPKNGRILEPLAHAVMLIYCIPNFNLSLIPTLPTGMSCIWAIWNVLYPVRVCTAVGGL
jgi:hypothetical protein